jgi:hypothetical protein
MVWNPLDFSDLPAGRRRALDEQRRLKRWHLIYYLRVFDHENGALVGHIVDITTEGIKLLSPWPIPPSKLFELRMDIPQDGTDSSQLVFKASSLWTRPDVNPDFHVTGFQLVKPSERTTNSIQRLIRALGF